MLEKEVYLNEKIEKSLLDFGKVLAHFCDYFISRRIKHSFNTTVNQIDTELYDACP